MYVFGPGGGEKGKSEVAEGTPRPLPPDPPLQDDPCREYRTLRLLPPDPPLSPRTFIERVIAYL